MPQEYQHALAFNGGLRKLLAADKYLSRKDYHHWYEEYKADLVLFESLASSGMLASYVEKNQLEETEIDFFVTHAAALEDIAKEPPYVRAHNKDFVERHIAA